MLNPRTRRRWVAAMSRVSQAVDPALTAQALGPERQSNRAIGTT